MLICLLFLLRRDHSISITHGCLLSIVLQQVTICQLCAFPPFSLPQKVEFLTKFYEGVSKGFLDKEIENFCEGQVAMAESRKQKQREQRKAQRRAERIALLTKEADAMKHLPQNV